jgi:RHS repeat-associated protein
VQAQFADQSTALFFQQNGGQEVYSFNWNGSFNGNDSYGGPGLQETYSVAPGSGVSGGPNPLTCPTSANYCDVLVSGYGGDGRQILEAFNSNSQISEIIGPNGIAYNLGYSAGNLVSVSSNITGSASTWSFVYDPSAPNPGPDTSDLVQVYDPDSGVGSSPPVSAGAAHSNYIAYNNSGTDVGMVSEVEDGTGAVTTYSYASGCSTGGCVSAGNTQSTIVTYPAQVSCPTCTAVSPVENDQYTSGVETQTSLGASGGGANSEKWQYAWSLGYGAANSTETITYPDSLSGSSPTATIVLDPAGNIISTTDALGDVATSAYNDTGANILPELLWSYPGSSSNGPSNPPSGSEVYTYNTSGFVETESDPLGNVTKFGYYTGNEIPCYVEPPTVAAGTGSPASCPSDEGSLSPGTTPPVGSTAYAYDSYGDRTATYVDYGDTASGSDPHATTSSHDLLGDELWSIPPAGQGGTQSSSNPYATVSTYLPNGLMASVALPSEGTTEYTYDLALNATKVQTPYSSVYQMAVFDGDNRPCYQLTNTLQTGLTCSTGAQAGSTTTTYVPGSTSPASIKDGNGHTTSYYYGDLAFPNSPTEVVDAANDAVQYTAFDDFGFVCESGSVSIAIGTSTQCNAVSGDTTTTYNALGNETSITDPSGNATTSAYTNTAFPTSITSATNALSAVTSYTYNADGELTKITNPDTTSISTTYDADGRVCVQADNGTTYSCGGGIGVAGVTSYSYNGANDRTSMTTYTPSTLSMSYSYSTGQLTATTDSNGKTTAYLYNYAGQVQCETYPVSTSTTCGTLSSPATGSTTNTIVTRGYDASGRLSTVKDWLGNTTTYAYTKTSAPLAVTSITYPSSSGLVSTMTQDNDGSLASLTAGSSISDSWSYDSNQRVSTMGVNGSTSAATVYNANNQVTGATNLAHTTSNDTYTLAPNGEITQDAVPSGATTSYSYNAGAELCSATAGTSATSCGMNPSNGTSYTYTTNGQRSSATLYSNRTAGAATKYAWNPYGELCNAATSTTSCGSAPSVGGSYTYNGDGLRMTSSTNVLPPTTNSIAAVGSLAQAEGTGISTLSVSPVNVGDAFVLAAKVKDTTVTISSISGGGATWQKLTNAGSNPDVELWLGTITSTGSSTITVTYTGSVSADAIELDAQEYTNGTGSTTTWSQDVVGSSNNTGSSTTVTFPTLTPSATHELYVGFARTPNMGSAGYTSGFTYDITSPNTNIYIYDSNVSTSVSPTAVEGPAGTSIAVGALITSSALMVTDSTWDYVSGGNIPLNINDAATRGSTTTNASYVYGDLLYGGTAPIEQLVTTGSGTTASFIVASPQGVQGVYSSAGAVQELAAYSPYGLQTISSGTRVTPFGFQGSYTDSTGLIYLINRYYDPTTDEFLSIDPDVAITDQPYAFTNDNPLNATDPLGLLADEFEGGPSEEEEPGTGTGNGTTPEGEASSETSIKYNLSKLEEGNNQPNVTVKSQTQLRRFLDENTKGGKVVFDGGVSGGGLVRYELPDGTSVQYRGFSRSGGDTIDIKFPGDPDIVKVHIK